MDVSRVRLSRATERTVVRCSVCDRRVGAVHATRFGPVLVTLEYASKDERADYELERDELGIVGDTPEYPAKLPPVEHLRWLDGSPLTPAPLPVAASCPNHEALELDVDRVTAAYNARARFVTLDPS